MYQEIESSWQAVLAPEFEKPYFTQLTKLVTTAYQTTTVYPPQKQIFTAFKETPWPEVRVVILGQDPYHGPDQAHGLAFSVQTGQAIPPSLHNIYKEMVRDLKIEYPSSGDLTRLAKEGVFLLNSTLTVEAKKAGSHQSFGWETFTDTVIETIAKEKEHIVFLLWGSFAIAKRQLINETKHLVLTAPHPSPLSAYRGFFGCRHFTKANAYLTAHRQEPISW
ncbi:MAG: hypothetical protein RLZZ70_396 [Candidatus Parcubacteria bacterium]|jgi:uracil-DNA glycosylase